MAKSLIMVKYVWEQKHKRAGMKNRKSPNSIGALWMLA